jgi:hypothetical protein
MTLKGRYIQPLNRKCGLICISGEKHSSLCPPRLCSSTGRSRMEAPSSTPSTTGTGAGQAAAVPPPGDPRPDAPCRAADCPLCGPPCADLKALVRALCPPCRLALAFGVHVQPTDAPPAPELTLDQQLTKLNMSAATAKDAACVWCGRTGTPKILGPAGRLWCYRCLGPPSVS